MYAPDGRAVCTKCFGTMDTTGRAPHWSKLAVIGTVLGIVPFFVSFSSTQSFVVNGQTASVTFRDWFWIGCGAVAAVLGAMTLRTAPKEQPQRKAVMTGGLVALGLGLFQIARGFGAI